MKLSRKLQYLLDNRWTLLTIVVSSIILVMIGRNVMHALRIRIDIVSLEQEKEGYQERITSDSTLLEVLKFDKELERFARENYYMQGKNEEIFIIKE